MKIEGPKKTDSSSKTGKSGKARKSSSGDKASFINHLSAAMGGDGEIEQTDALASTAGVAGILGIQAAEEATERESRKQAIEYGGDVLADLDDLRMGLITGRYSLPQLERLSQNLQNRRDNITDEKLIEILNEIDLRAQVEIAKYQYK